MAQLFPVAKKLWVGPCLVLQDSNLSHGLVSSALLLRHFLYQCFFLFCSVLFDVSHKAVEKTLLNYYYFCIIIIVLILFLNVISYYLFLRRGTGGGLL
jgi:predicted Kef-type K+ transport protein